MTTMPMKNNKANFEFIVSPRFEIFYALQVLLDKQSRIHSEWRKQAQLELSGAFFDDLAQFGDSPIIWPLIADSLRDYQGNLNVDQICKAILATDNLPFQREIISGAIHDSKLTDDLITGKTKIREAFLKVPTAKREWLAFIGLYPYDEQAPIVKLMKLLASNPDKFKRAAVSLIEQFWVKSFRQTWSLLEPSLLRSCEEKSRLLSVCTLNEFANRTLLRIEVDEGSEMIRAARGGYELSLSKIRRGFILPSAFNDQRYWTAYEFKEGVDVYLPYFDPEISPQTNRKNLSNDLSLPELDPFLVFKALGDATRFAILKLIAQQPRSAADIAKELNLSKPTISHHVHVLRDAGILNEKFQSKPTGSVILSINESTFEILHQKTLDLFFTDKSAGDY
jgi:DNA-binding transcriptional ArsR family regulator